MDIQHLTSIAQALSDTGRIRILAALGAPPSAALGELCVCQLIELLDLAPSTVSKHLLLLKQAGLVHSRKQGRWMYYRLPGDDAPPEIRAALAWANEALATDPTLAADAERLRSILEIDPEDLCCQQRTRTEAPSNPADAPASACCSSAPGTPAEARWPRAGPVTSKAT